ncbi:MAG: hypothetical protein JXA95_18245 [Spirochaetales bacterium]|nr:hypothetical protein [Spirochaetales bacterium]
MDRKIFDCLKCSHYYVTWDRNFPHGCRLFDFKTGGSPSREVLKATGQSCPSFTPKFKG